ncbi:MAG: penicillin acylase family protein [Myxococcales bacterium]|nr:penicillin acylase family protein [Myxococcales bacterium]
MRRRTLAMLRTSWRASSFASLIASSVTALSLAGCGGLVASETATDSGGDEQEARAVEIFIDDRGVTHIYADNDDDLMWAAGYQMATDRLFQMDLMRRRALGRRAEVLGEGYVDSDTASRIMNFPRWGAADAERLRVEQPVIYALFESWVEGVNQRVDEINSGVQPLPYGFGDGPGELAYAPERWSIEDPFIVAKLLMFGNSNQLEYELLATLLERLFGPVLATVRVPQPVYPVWTLPEEDRPPPSSSTGAPPSPRAAAGARLSADELGRLGRGLSRLRRALAPFRVQGSNSWAVSGRFTESGRSLICNDPHQPLESPSLMYAQHLNSADARGRIDVAGFSFVGAPAVHLGHNRRVSWAATTGFADVMDMWGVELSGDQTTATLGDASASVTWREEPIAVRGGAPVSVTAGDVEQGGQYRGVLIGDALLEPLGVDQELLVGPGRHILMNWTGFRPTVESAAFAAMNLADSVDDYESASAMIDVGTFNWLSADHDDISYQTNVLIPDRGGAAHSPYLVMDNVAESFAPWAEERWLPQSKMPQSRASRTGFIATANNDPWGFTADGDVHNDPWYYGYYFAVGYRAKRLQDELRRLTKRGGVTLEDMTALQTDVYSTNAELLLPKLDQAWAAAQDDPALAEYKARPELGELVARLQAWDRRMSRESSEALAFHAFANLVTARALGDDLSLLLGAIMDIQPPWGLKLGALTLTGGYEGSEGLLQGGEHVVVLDALAQTADWLTESFGDVDPSGYRWGDRHGTAFRNPTPGLNVPWLSTDGGDDTVNVSMSPFFEEAGLDEVRARWESHDGPIFRACTGFDDDGTPVTWMNYSVGNSADPESPRYTGALDDWRAGAYRQLLFRRAEIEDATVTSFTLERPAAP